MSDRRKMRNLQKELRYSFFLDLTILLISCLPFAILGEEISKVGDRNLIAYALLYAASVITLMYFFEKYAVGISGLWEKIVIVILSSVYSYVLLALTNWLLFGSMALFMRHTIASVTSMAVLIFSNVILDRFFENSKRYRKSRLLIIDSDNKNLYRMKRIKYGVTKHYDSWYEHINTHESGYMEKFVEEKFPDFDAVCILDGLDDYEYEIAIKKAMELNREIFVVPKIIDMGKCRAPFVRFDDVLTLYIPSYSLSWIEAAIKRGMDILLSGIALLVAAIPMLIISLLIKLTSPGPVFYKQTRLTKDRKAFEIYKFRTMIPDAEKLSGPMFAQKDDPRITPIGKVLRSLRLDELPQLLNIFKGDMSIVGPRPERPVFVEQFEKEVENYGYRFMVKAGLTALSHVYGRYSTYIHDRTCYDLYYIANYSIFLDLKIILLTTKTMFLKSAAEGEDSFKVKTTSNENVEVGANEK